MLRALNFQAICERKTLWMGDGELIVGERGPAPKAVPTYPELTCHSAEDLRILDSRPKTQYKVDPSVIDEYERDIIPFWQGRSLRDQMFAMLPQEWHDAYAAGCYTEFMEQRAPGHTVADGKIYRKGMLDFKADIARAVAALDFEHDPEALDKREQLRAMAIACDARHPVRRAPRRPGRRRGRADGRRRRARRELLEDRRRLPPGAGPRAARLPRGAAVLLVLPPGRHHRAERLGRLQPRPPRPAPLAVLPAGAGRRHADARVGARAAGVLLHQVQQPPRPAQGGRDRRRERHLHRLRQHQPRRPAARRPDGSNEVTHLLLDIIDEMHLLQPSTNIQVSRKTPDVVLKHALRVIRNGYGFPSLFNADAVVEEQLRQGKTLEDAREGGCSGCVEVGAFGKEAYILTGYFNLMKMLELALHDGFDARTGKSSARARAIPAAFATFDDLFAAFDGAGAALPRHQDPRQPDHRAALRHAHAAPFLSVITDDCIAKGKDYNAGGARYNNTFIQAVGIGSVTDSLSALKELVFDTGELPLRPLRRDARRRLRRRRAAAAAPPQQDAQVRQRRRLRRRADDADVPDAVREHRRPAEHQGRRLPPRDAADHVPRLFRRGLPGVGRRARRGPARVGGHQPGAGRRPPRPDRRAEVGVEDGPREDGRHAAEHEVHAGPARGRGRHRPAAQPGALVLQARRPPHAVQRGDGRHAARGPGQPGAHRDLIVRVAGYSDYFCDLSEALQDEIIRRTEHVEF